MIGKYRLHRFDDAGANCFSYRAGQSRLLGESIEVGQLQSHPDPNWAGELYVLAALVELGQLLGE